MTSTVGRPPGAWILACRTCERDVAVAGGERSKGQQIADGLSALLAAAPPGEQLRLRIVSCLSGCRRPANVSLRAAGKPTLRLSCLEPSDTAAVVTLAGQYLDHPTGDPPQYQWPAPLRAKPVVRIPSPGAGRT